MSDKQRRSIEGVPLEGLVDPGVRGDQSFVVAGHEIEVEDAAHRRRLEQQRADDEIAQKKHDRRKDWVTFCLVVGAMIVGLLLGVALIFRPPSAEASQWGLSIVLLILGALGGYITGSKTS